MTFFVLNTGNKCRITLFYIRSRNNPETSLNSGPDPVLTTSPLPKAEKESSLGVVTVEENCLRKDPAKDKTSRICTKSNSVKVDLNKGCNIAPKVLLISPKGKGVISANLPIGIP